MSRHALSRLVLFSKKTANEIPASPIFCSAALLAAAAASMHMLGGEWSDPGQNGEEAFRNTTLLEENSHNQHSHHQQQEHVSNYSPIWPMRIIRPNPNLEICFDTRTRNAIYVQHRIVVTDEGHVPKKERLNFKEDTTVEEKYRSRNSYYHLTGYDRGHLAPAADFDHRRTSSITNNELQDSYNLCNVSPQNADMNRKIWAWLEDWTRQVARAAWKKQRAITYVTTGPLWLPRVQLDDKVFQYNIVGIGKAPTLVMVPTHFFKVVVIVHKERIVNFACFVVPNESSANDKTMPDYVVSWTDLETVTGLSLYPGLVDDIFKAKADALTLQATSAHRGSASKQLLLTDKGSHQTSSSALSRKYVHEMSHLCNDQACLPRKDRQGSLKQ